ncbi:hypothetical protein TNCV_761331 [Trichonephila clavipes]|nr:hypothetical protein TNCV_761331 [Trichonephila clavipes]
MSPYPFSPKKSYRTTGLIASKRSDRNANGCRARKRDLPLVFLGLGKRGHLIEEAIWSLALQFMQSGSSILSLISHIPVL